MTLKKFFDNLEYIIHPKKIISYSSSTDVAEFSSAPKHIPELKELRPECKDFNESADKLVYMFDEGNTGMLNLLGGKGAHLAEMIRLGMPVPPGFTITTKAFHEYKLRGILTSSLKEQVDGALQELEQKTGKKFGSSQNPLLVSVRSGAPVSMPGMMDTVLNVGMNNDVIEGLISVTNNPKFVYDTYLRFIKMFCENVIGLKIKQGSNIKYYIDNYLRMENFTQPHMRRSHIDTLHEKINEEANYCTQIHRCTSIPQDSKEQLYRAIEAVLLSWNLPKAQEYRKIHNIPDDLGTAVNVQAMVFGNLGNDSLTGVCFSRDTDTGRKVLSGEVLYGAQGEDVVSGSVTPLSISNLKKKSPHAYKKLVDLVNLLEDHFKDIQDIEFTQQNNKLYLLQTRKAKRTHTANITATLDMMEEGLIDEKEAIQRISEDDINFILNQLIIEPNQNYTLIGKGETSSGIATGKVVFTSEKAIEYQKQGQKVILVKKSTDTDDILGMRASEGILTAIGGQTSHAAVVARGMNKICIAGCKTLEFANKPVECYFTLKNNERVIIKEGEYITLNGTTGEVIKGRVKTLKPENNPFFEKLKCLIQPYLDNDTKIVEIDSVSDINKRLSAKAELGIFSVSSWFLAGDNLKSVRDYILSLGSGKKQLEHVTKELTEQYKSIFTAKNSRIYCSLLEEGLDLFIPEKNITNHYYQTLESIGDLLTKDVRKQQNSWLLQAEKIKTISSEERESLEKGILEAQISAILTAASQTNTVPIINISFDLIKRYGNNDITNFVAETVKKVKKNLQYTSEVEITREIEKNHFIFRPSTYLQDAFAYVKMKGDFK